MSQVNSQYGIYDRDRSILLEMQEAVLGPTGAARLDRKLEPPAPPLPRPANQILVGFAQLGAAIDATFWNWKFAVLDHSTGQFTTQSVGSDNMGKCRILPGCTAGNGSNGLLYWHVQDDGKRCLFFVPLAGGLIPVTLSTDSGGDGSTTAAPTYTYKNPVNAITGIEILKADGSHATGLSPAWARSYGSFNQASHGTVYINSSGDPVLWQVDETEKVCT